MTSDESETKTELSLAKAADQKIMVDERGASPSTPSALGLSNLLQKTNAANSASKDSKAHSAPASQSGLGANIPALGLSNLPHKTNAASSASKDSNAHSAPASQSGLGAPSPRGETDLKNPPSVSVTSVQTSEDLPPRPKAKGKRKNPPK